MGVEEKKRIREANEILDKQMPTVRKAIGNEALKFELHADESTKAQELNIAKDNIEEFTKGLLKLSEDADYREELAKIQNIKISLVPSLETSENSIYGRLKLDGTTLNVTVDGHHALNNGSSNATRDALKKLY